MLKVISTTVALFLAVPAFAESVPIVVPDCAITITMLLDILLDR